MNRQLLPLSYWNSNGIAAAIVAVATLRRDGSILDWTAYAGGSLKTQKEWDAYEDVAENGDKIDRKLAIFHARRRGYIELKSGLYRE